MLKGAIFDFDGTLFDSMPVWNNVGERYLQSMGYTPKENLSDTLKTMSLQQSSCYLKTEYGIQLSTDDIISEINNLIKNSYINTILPKNGVQTFLEELKNKNIRMCIATATDRPLIEAALQRCNMTQYFQDILTCSSVGSAKDEPYIFRQAMNTLNTNRDETIVFEDAYHAVKTAKNDGFSVVGVYDEYEDSRAEVEKISDIYLKNYTDTDKFWKYVANF